MTVHKKTCHCGRIFYTMVAGAEECAECLTNRVRDDVSTASLLAGVPPLPDEDGEP